MRAAHALALLALLGCAKAHRGDPAKGTAPDASTAEAAARSFVLALAAGDLATAEKLLPDAATCTHFAGDAAGICQKSVPKLHERLPELVATLKGFKPGRIHDTDQPPPGMPPGVRVLEVEPEGGGKPVELIAVGDKESFRIAFPMRMKKVDAPVSPTPPG